MSRYIKKHRRTFAGVAAPVFILFVLVAIGLTIQPGWVKNSYGNPGDPCTPPDEAGVCDPCNGEECQNFGIVVPDYRCAFWNGSAWDTTSTGGVNPCPTYAIWEYNYPGCWTGCTEEPVPSAAPIAVCSPDDSYCEGMSGGDSQTSDCRTGTCTPISTPDPNNPSGCDYQRVDTDVDINCGLCDPQPPDYDPCGNGSCEVTFGEDCVTCPIDCLLPGFEDQCPLTSGQIIDDACEPVFNITFGGPPWNPQNTTSQTGECEDGDLCTDNACEPIPGATWECSVTEKNCSQDTEDFCCPADCSPPADETQGCGNDAFCDVDCGPVEECPFCGNNIIDPGEECDGTAPNNCGDLGCDDATCQCNTPSQYYLEGSGLLPCSLQKNLVIDPMQGGLALLSLGVALGAFFLFRRRLS